MSVGNTREEMARLTIPSCVSAETVIDRNLVRQLLIPAQEVEVPDLTAESTIPRLANGSTFRLVRRESLLTDAELGLLVPHSAELTPGADLREVPHTRWLGPRDASSPEDVLASLKGAFSYVVDDPGESIRGLRQPQIGALHSVLGYWTMDPKEPATVVMPTGTGKTETMLALFAERRIERLLVVVPSDVLRAQISAKFECFGVLQEFGVVSPRALFPIVGQLKHSLASADLAESFARACNVVIATPQALAASNDEVRAALLACFTDLFVDEAHHVQLKHGFGFEMRLSENMLFNSRPLHTVRTDVI